MALIQPPTNLNLRTSLLMADTGGGKTTQLALIAKWLFKKYGIRTRLIEADGGGTIQFDDEDLIESGIVQRFNLATVEHKIRYLQRMSKGYWPNANGDIALTDEFLEGAENYQCLMFDSLTGYCEMLTEHVSQPDSNIKFKLGTISSEGSEAQDEYKFGTLDKPHFQIMHKLLQTTFNMNFKAIPHLQYFFVTAKVKSGEDRTRTRAYVPLTVGGALDAQIGGWFQDFFHLSTELVTGEQVQRHLKIKDFPKDQLEKTGYMKVAWFQEHKDADTGIKYPCKARIGPSLVDQVTTGRFREGFVILDTDLGLNRYYEYIKSLKKLQASSEKVETID